MSRITGRIVRATRVFVFVLPLASFGAVPLYFEENRGQTDARARYIARSEHLVGFVTQDGWTLSLNGQPISMHIADANAKATLVPQNLVEGITNYYLGSRAITNLPHYSSVRAQNIRPKIDIIYHGNERELEYDLVVHPGADPRALWLRFDGSRPVLADNGDILLTAGKGEVRQHKPRVWQETNGQRTELECSYVIAESGDVGFVFSNYDQSAELIVDPIISYSTYLGGSDVDTPSGIAADGGGYAYVTGSTASADFPVTSGTYQGSGDVFVTKLNPSGTGLVYSTFIGGTSLDASRGIALDSAGSAYVTGYTQSTDFPVTVNQLPPGHHAFVLKLGASGNIVYSTALAGNGSEETSAIATDAAGSAYVTGYTTSTNFPVTPGSYKTTPAAVFVAKLSSIGQISYATYLGAGGIFSEYPTAIAVDGFGNAYVGGTTSSPDFPATPGAYATAFAGGFQDGFVAKLNPSGSGLVYATFLGGAAEDLPKALAVDAAGNCYVTGATHSDNFPTTAGAFSTIKGPSYYSPFVTKLNATGTALVYSTFLGGSGYDIAAAIAVDSAGSAYVAGSTLSDSFPTTAGALMSAPSSSAADMFLTKLAAGGGSLAYSTRLGGNAPSNAAAVALDGSGGVYVAGVTQSAIYPTTAGAYQANPKNSTGQFLAIVGKIDLNVPTLCNPSVSPQSQSVPAHGGPISFNLTLAFGCPWDAGSDSNSVTLNRRSGVISTSPILITGVVGQNDSFTDVGIKIRIGTATFTANQAAGSCHDPVLSPSSVAFDSNSGIRDLSILLPAGCNWLAEPGAPWLTVLNGSGTASGSVTIFVGPNSFSPRSTTLTIAGKTIAVTQSGSTCTATANILVTGTSSQGSDGVVSVATSSPTCVWGAYTAAPWIGLGSPTVAQGSGFVPFVVAANPGILPRTGQILVADVLVSVTQDAGPAGVISSYTLSTFAGQGIGPDLGDGGPALNAHLNSPDGLAFDRVTGNLYIVEFPSRVRVVTPDGNIHTFAGGGSGTGENIPATSAKLDAVTSVAVDNSSAVYINESSRVRKISNGNIVTFAGGLDVGFGGDNGPATSAMLRFPNGTTADSTGNIYIADKGNQRVRKVSGGTITTIAGGGFNGLGDNGPATSANLVPYGIALDTASNLLIADVRNNDGTGTVRKVAQGIITTVAGGGFGGDGPATSAILYNLSSIAAGIQGDFFISERGYNRIRRVSADGFMATIANNVDSQGLATDSTGNLYIGDIYTGTVLKAAPRTFFCAYLVNAPPQMPPQIPPGGGSFQISILTGAACRWNTLLIPTWLTPNSATTGVGFGTIAFTAAPNPDATTRIAILAISGVTVRVTQAGTASTLAVNRSILNFAASQNGTATGPQTVTVSFTGGGGLQWTAASNRSNIVVSQGGHSGNGSFQVSVSAGPSGVVTVTAPGVIGSPKQIQVDVYSPAAGSPFGSFDTPVNNTTGVAGAIPVTGWALDAVEVLKVDIWREPVGSEPAGALIFIGDAVFVEGARPDVEGLYPNLPFSYRAGWGYQMLTNFLPNGNGTFKLHAIAHNKAGSSMDLGVKTIVVDNAHASKPFGTIDTPGQGGDAFGNAFLNFGWALTQNPNKIPIDGSTITVVIDGVPVGHPTYNQFRSDIANLFPGLMNSGGAVGFFYIDTTMLASGVHTISWNVFDNAGHGEGLGSRYFSVFNSGGGPVAKPEEPLPWQGIHVKPQLVSGQGRPRRRLVANGRGSEEQQTRSPLQTRNRAATVRERSPSIVEIEEVGLVELPLGAVSGYELVNGEHRPLPIGSSLKRGVFYWQPGPGFLGEYHLVFEQKDGTEVRVRVKIGPKKYPNGI